MKIFTQFDVLRRHGLSSFCLPAARREIHECERALREFDRKVQAAIDDPRLSPRSKRFISRQWHGDPGGGALCLSNRLVHRSVMIASITTLLVHAQNSPMARKGRLRLRMLTTTPNLGITDFAKPELKLSAVCRHLDVVARRASVHALAFMDIAIVEDRTLGPMKIALHMHAVVNAKSLSFRARRAVRFSSPVNQPRNALGLKVVKITSRRKDWGKCLSRRNIAHLGYYVRKISCGKKIVFESEGRRRAKTTLDGWKLVHALRQLECLSHCDAFATTRGVGEGAHLRKSWKKLALDLIGLDDTARGLEIKHAKLESKWARVWEELGDKNRAAHFVG